MAVALNPCVSCGACCASFRVSFFYREADDHTPGGVPVELTEDLTDFRRVMKGTNDRAPKCVALCGTIGVDGHCSVYARRPSVCREFPASYADGMTPNPVCDRARAAHGLPPVKPSDWRRTDDGDDHNDHDGDDDGRDRTLRPAA